MQELLDYQLQAEALSIDEVEYELKVRKLAYTGTDRQKLIALKKVLDTEKEPPLDSIADEKEFNMAIEKLGELQKLFKRVIQEGNESDIRMVKAKIRHYQDRAFRAAGNNEETDSILYGQVRNIKRTQRMSTEERETTIIENTQLSQSSSNSGKTNGVRTSLGRGRGIKHTQLQSLVSDRREEIGASTSQQAKQNVTQSDDGDINKMLENLRFRDAEEVTNRADLNRSTPQRWLDAGMPRMERRRIAMEKWPVRFSGDGSLPLTDFLRKLELYAEADEVKMKDIYKGIFKLLEGIALEWYEVNAGYINSWEDLVNGLKLRFLSQNYDYRVREEILERMQRNDESIADYLMKMNKLFLKVYPPLDEGYKVYVLQRNMLPNYRLQLTIADVSSVAQLEKLCKNMDEARLMDSRQQHHLPSQVQPTSAVPVRRFLLKRGEQKVVEAVQDWAPRASSFVRKQQLNRNDQSTTKCWNCLQTGHRHFDCGQPRDRVYCWCCGMNGFRADECPRNHRGGALFTCAEREAQNEKVMSENSNMG